MKKGKKLALPIAVRVHSASGGENLLLRGQYEQGTTEQTPNLERFYRVRASVPQENFLQNIKKHLETCIIFGCHHSSHVHQIFESWC